MVHMLIYQHSWSQQGQKKLFWSEVRSYETGLGRHQRPEKEETREINEGGQRSDRIQASFSLVSCLYMQQTSLTKVITEKNVDTALKT